MKVPIIEAEYVKDQFSKYRKVFPAHELPLYQLKYGQENINVEGKSDRYHDIDKLRVFHVYLVIFLSIILFI